MDVFDNGIQPTYADALAMGDNPPAGWEQVMNGQTPHKRWKDFTSRYGESIWNNVMVPRVAGLAERANARVEDADATLDLTEETIAKTAKDLGSRRMSPDEVLEVVRQIPPVLTTVMQDLDASAEDAKLAAAFLDQDPAEFQKAEIERFPQLRQALPRVTGAWLTGDASAPDPLAGPRDPDGA
jgi:hypothetical protein